MTAARGTSTPNFFPSRTYGAGRPHVGLCTIFLVLSCGGEFALYLTIPAMYT